MSPPSPAPSHTTATRWDALRSRWHRLSHYWQHFIVAVLLGIGIEVGIHLAHDTALVRKAQNIALDTSLRMFSLRDKVDTPEDPLPVLLLEDDVSAQSPRWGQDRAMTLPMALQLVANAFDRGAQHVMLDVTFDASLDNLKPEYRDALGAFVAKYATPAGGTTRHLYVARSLRVDPCFPHVEALETLRPAVWDDLDAVPAGAVPGLVIHSVLPNYRADEDQIVRGWDLFGVAREADDATPDGARWRFLPSPQLAYLNARNTPGNQLHALPWLSHASAPSTTTSRAAFAASQVAQVPLLALGNFNQKLCASHPDTLGCAVPHTPQATAHATTPEEALHDVNALLRPLPVEHACRPRATELMASDSESLHPEHPHDLLFNRIVFNLPHWVNARDVMQRGYYIRTPLTLEGDDLNWTNRLIAIGAGNAVSGDWHATPIGQIPGVLINLNAMQSLDRIGPVSTPPGWASLLVNGLIILAVAAVFSALSPGKAALVSGAILVGSMALFHEYLLSRGIWIEFGAPMLGINLHRIIDGYLAKIKHATRGKPQKNTHVNLQPPP